MLENVIAPRKILKAVDVWRMSARWWTDLQGKRKWMRSVVDCCLRLFHSLCDVFMGPPHCLYLSSSCRAAVAIIMTQRSDVHISEIPACLGHAHPCSHRVTAQLQKEGSHLSR